MNQDIFRKAQEEIDSVIEPSRLPNFGDRNKLPYLEAILKEVHRFNPVANLGTISPLFCLDYELKTLWMWLGLPHRLTEDDTYEGYHLPAGSTVIANIWSVCFWAFGDSWAEKVHRGILHDPALYPSPFNFDPERYLRAKEQGPTGELNPDPTEIAFGFGRRICPGQYLAQDTLFIIAATTLSIFDIKPSLGPDGHVLKYSGAYTGGTIRYTYVFHSMLSC